MDALHGVPRAIGAHVLRGIVILLGAGQGCAAFIPQGDPGLFDIKGPGQNQQRLFHGPGPLFQGKEPE